MQIGEFLTSLTIWLALGGYAGGAWTFWRTLDGRGQARARNWWTLGAIALLAHTVCALHVYHRWDQAAVWRETARQTAALTGWEWGGGVIFNYVLLLLWLADVAWWWRNGLAAYVQRPAWLTASWHGFLLFMVFNATVVFKTNWLRWAGWALCLSIVWAWRSGWRRVVQNRPTPVKGTLER